MSIFYLIKLAPILCFKKYPVCGNGAKFTQTILLYLQRARDKVKRFPGPPPPHYFKPDWFPPPQSTVVFPLLFSACLNFLISVLSSEDNSHWRAGMFHRLQLNTKVSGIVQILRQFKVHLSLYERGERTKIWIRETFSYLAALLYNLLEILWRRRRPEWQMDKS